MRKELIGKKEPVFDELENPQPTQFAKDATIRGFAVRKPALQPRVWLNNPLFVNAGAAAAAAAKSLQSCPILCD